MALTHIIAKRFRGTGIEYQAGEVVDATAWQWREALENQGKIRRILPGEESIECDCGRNWLSMDRAANHCQKAAVPA